MRAHEGTARRYAKALHLVARESRATEAVGGELDAIAAVIREDRELRQVLTRPWIKPADRRGIAAAVAERAGAGKTIRDFVGLLAERGRIDHFTEIAAAYRVLLDEELGRARAEVRTAVPLTDAERRSLAERLGRALGKQVLLEERVDQTLLGGFIAQVGSLILDGSLDAQLGRMRERLARGQA
jgi:F-type H+-transporting ATPase subunit delta